MSLNSDAMQYLLDKGFSAAEMVEFARIAERRADPTAAERMARHRAKKAATRNVTRNPPKESIHTPADISNEIPARPARTRAVAPAVEIEVPSWVPAKPWADFVAMRTAKKKPVDASIAEKLFAKLAEIAAAGWDVAKVLDKSTVNLWQGVFMPTEGRDEDMRARRTAKPAAEMSELDRKRADLFRRHQAGEFGQEEFFRQRAELEQQLAQPPPGEKRLGTAQPFSTIAAHLLAQAPAQ